ncbi:MAG TPA: FIST N-terminal domain-containing protein, partial [Acetobacteraceae bacterium]|nr:FIST N-terminal domain-containing protein [Acetobacteraceae bacterium]
MATKTTRFPAGLWPDQEISSRDSAPGGLWSEQRGVATAYTKCADTRVAIAALAEGTADAAPVPVFLLLFLGGRHDPETALDAVKATFPGIPLLGVSGTGVIASEGFGYTGFEAGVIAWADDRTAPRLVVTTRLIESDHAGGAELGRVAKSLEPDSATVLLFYSSVRSFEPRELHSASKLIDGFYDGWHGEAPTL